MTNRKVIGNMALIDLLTKINDGITGCIFAGLDRTHENKCNKYDDGKCKDCYNCIAEWLNKESYR